MKNIILNAGIILIITAATATAGTIIIEYTDHYYVEATGNPSVSNNSTLVAADATMNVKMAAATMIEKVAATESPVPVTSFEDQQSPLAPDERRAAMERVISRIEMEQAELMQIREGDTPDQIAERQQEALGKLRKLNRLKTELSNLPVQ